MADLSTSLPTGIDPQTDESINGGIVPYNFEHFKHIGVLDAWEKYGKQLNWGKGQCLAILDDGCDIGIPEWTTQLPWGPKVMATWNAIDGNTDPSHVPPGYHGTTVGIPSSSYYKQNRGVAYNNFVIHVRCVSVVHLTGQEEASTMKAGLEWVLAHLDKYPITAVNVAPLDDERHQQAIETEIDPALKDLRQRGIWVSSPCGNHNYTDGISWPACQPFCFGIGATSSKTGAIHLDRFSNTDLLVCADATSSSNAYANAAAMILREAIEYCSFSWSKFGETLPDAIMAIFKQTGRPIPDPETGFEFRELNLLAALDFIFA